MVNKTGPNVQFIIFESNLLFVFNEVVPDGFPSGLSALPILIGIDFDLMSKKSGT